MGEYKCEMCGAETEEEEEGTPTCPTCNIEMDPVDKGEEE